MRPPSSRLAPLLALCLGAAASLPAQNAPRRIPGDDPLPAGDPVPPGAGLPLLAQAAPASAPASEGAMPMADLPPGAPPPPAGLIPPRAPSVSVTVNLINRLVDKGVLTKEDASALLQQAEMEALSARAQMQAEANAAAAQIFAAQKKVARPPAGDAVRVTYVPEVVQRRIREDLRAEVLAAARSENWTAPRALPGWVTRWTLFGDVRFRYQGDYYPSGNDNTGAFPNFNAINTGAPFDVAGSLFSPQYNVDQDRERLRLRARLGAAVDLGENFTAGLRIGTGESNTPVSQNQTLGVANGGQGGNFSKYAVWLDRGFVRFQLTGDPKRDISFTAGRFDNPFFSTSIIWADEIGFDGVALQGSYEVRPGLRAWGVAGAFPVFNTDLNFASNQPTKFESTDKWLYAGQIGADWQPHKDWSLKLGVAYYHFDGVEGRLSTPYTPLTAADAGDTDNTRPSFAQRGNTYRPLRDIVPSAANNFGTINQFQYFGLATKFRDLSVTGRIEYNRYEPVQISLIGEYIRNVGLQRGTLETFAVNNRGAGTAANPLGRYAGGGQAWTVALRAGSPRFEKRWDWFAGVGYRHIESDAVVDAFTDSDFGGGGTNLSGFIVGGSVALSQRVSVSLRWMSANSIDGPRFRNDTFQFDLNARF